MSNKSGAAQQAISLPKGGGAIKGIGETFQANLFSGTGTHSIPIATSPGRNGFGPSLSLQYSSGNGNGIFGLGWELSIPSIARKTAKGLPQYNDADVFILSGAEDLVPCLKKIVDPSTGTVTWAPQDSTPNPTHHVTRYRPRIEGLFARIERWTYQTTGETFWRAITKDNVTSIYGRSPASRLADPDDPSRVYQWLLEESRDAFGNSILYEYAADDPRLYSHEEPALALSQIFESNRRATQLYVRRVCYGNLPDPLVDEQGSPITYSNGAAVGLLRDNRRYAFEVIFDYGDWESSSAQPHPEPPTGQQEFFGPDPSVSTEHNPVPIREDRFSTFRSGFEIRTLRRCRRVLMFHHFAELGGPTLVRSTDFTYHTDSDTRLSLLSDVTVMGYRKETEGTYRAAGMPPVTFGYTQFTPHEQRYQSIEALGDDMPPLSLKNPDVALVDLFGDGVPDVVMSGPGGMRYWRNLGGGVLDRARSLNQIPAAVAFNQPGVGFGDIGGDGRADLLVHSSPLAGFYETTASGTWKTFKPYRAFPTFDLSNPNVRLVDLTGDGRSDALMTETEHFVWFECLGEEGFAPPRYITRKHDLDQFPDVFFDDPAGRVRLADMTGDGLNDIVLVHDGRIDYWPNFGYGRFGRRITMANAPRLGMGFDPKRLFLADLTGTGCADLAYVDFDRVHFWFNQSGNAWGNRETILGTPLATDAAAIQFADVFGTGTATLVWSEDFAAQPESHYKALDFCGGIKPYVLTEMSNNMGATTRVRYAPSTKYSLEDLANGSPWITSLPFPVQVVDTVEVIDHISRTKLVTTYKYHHGYYDGREREFRGFGRVDQFDTETFEAFSQTGLHDAGTPFLNGDVAYYVPPVETRSWFHTGVYFDEDSLNETDDLFDYRELTQRFREEFYRDDTEAVPLSEHDVASEGTPHEAYRSLRGAVLRTEIYARDGSLKTNHPYQVTENRYRVLNIQPQDGSCSGMYFSHTLETATHHYDRNPTDPRMSHVLTLEVDDFGNSLRSLAIAYGRRQPDPGLPTEADREQQTRTLITYTESAYTNGVDDPLLDPDNYHTPLPCESRTYELTGFAPVFHDKYFRDDEWREHAFARLNNAITIPYEAAATPAQEQKRLIEHSRTRYRSNDLTKLLPLGRLESLALPGERHSLAFTQGLVAQIYGARVTDAVMTDEGGYIHSEGDTSWWKPSDRSFFSPRESDSPSQELDFARRHFFTPHRSRAPFGNTSAVTYDPYVFLPRDATDPAGNRVRAEYDYRLMEAFLVTDPNGNRAEVAFDTLGLVTGTAVMGKAFETQGDSLAGFSPDLTPQQLQDFLADPLGNASGLLGNASTRIIHGLDRFRSTGQPNFAAVLARETHVGGLFQPDGSKIQVTFSYMNGFEREIQKKLRAEPGPIDDGPPIDPRWVATGWTIFNNKGKPVKEYEPFFDGTHEFQFGNRIGVNSTLFYDPVGRVVATLHPDHTWEKIVFDPWRQETWDANDTVLIVDPTTDPDVGSCFESVSASDYLPTWYQQREHGNLGSLEEAAANKTVRHAVTPSVAYADSLGRTFLTVAHNRFTRQGTPTDEHYVTRVSFNCEGRQREVIDAKGRVTVQYNYSIIDREADEADKTGTGFRIYQSSMEAGERWMLRDVLGQSIYAWDSRGSRFRTTYDALRRPTDFFVLEDTHPEILASRTVYGESLPTPEAKNLRNKVARRFDQAGVVTMEGYDFKGNLLRSERRFATNYKTAIDWSTSPELEPDTFAAATTYDALNRPVTSTTPDGSIYHHTFNEANLLEAVDVHLMGSSTATPFVSAADYNAKGQRTLIRYANGLVTSSSYDPSTFRLRRLTTVRGVEPLQDLNYTYDSVGNLTHLEDNAQQSAYFNNQVVEANTDYVYDAMYRLIEAQGREHIGQTGQPEATWNDEFRVKLPHPHDGHAMRRYTERYEYDPLGNFERILHYAEGGNWTRTYAYDEPSQIEPLKRNNRVSRTVVGRGVIELTPEIYSYDAHGNMLAMAHLSAMEWNTRDQLRHVDLTGGGEAFFVYDAGGERVRKVLEKNNGTLIEERIYIGVFELYRIRRNGTMNLERHTLHVMDGEQRIALVETRTQGVDGSPLQLISYQLGNHLNSTSVETDAAGNLISYEEFYPYGSTSYQAMRNGLGERLKRYRYTGMERDQETGLSYHSARYYVPWLGRWTTGDPIGIEGGLNLYAYANDNPVMFSDRGGRDTKQQRWEKEFDETIPHLKDIDVTIGTFDEGQMTAAGVRVPLQQGDYLLPRPFYERKAAAQLAYQGFIHYAELVEAGHDAAALKLSCSRFRNCAPIPDAELDLAAYVGWSYRAKRSAEGVQVALMAASLAIAGAEILIAWRASRAQAAAALLRAETTQMNAQNVQGVTRTVTTATGQETFVHTTMRAQGAHTAESAAVNIAEKQSINLSPGGQSGQWGEGVYAYQGKLPATGGNAPPTVQFQVPKGTAIEKIVVPGQEPIIRLLPPQGNTLPIVNPTTNLSAADYSQAKAWLDTIRSLLE